MEQKEIKDSSKKYSILAAIIIWYFALSILGLLIIGGFIVGVSGGFGGLSNYLSINLTLVYIILWVIFIFLVFLGFQLYRNKKWAKITGLIIFIGLLILDLSATITSSKVNYFRLIIGIVGIILLVLSLRNKN